MQCRVKQTFEGQPRPKIQLILKEKMVVTGTQFYEMIESMVIVQPTISFQRTLGESSVLHR